MDSCPRSFLDQILQGPITRDPLSTTDDAAGPDDVALATGGCISLVAYWVFSATVFDADQPAPEMNILPDHLAILEKLLKDDAEHQIQSSPGTAEALVAIGLWLHANGRIHTASYELSINPTASEDDPTSEFMQYLHLVALVALYHQRLPVRNAATMLAGHILHGDPSEEDRLRILYDLLENCTFASLKACAVTWLREEIIAASSSSTSSEAAAPTKSTTNGGVFSTSQALDTVQYVVFPSLNSLSGLDAGDLLEFLAQNMPFLLQAVNFGLFLWSSQKWEHVLPANADATVKERWFCPLADAVDKVRMAVKGGVEIVGEEMGPLASELDVLRERMMRLASAEGFNVSDDADRV